MILSILMCLCAQGPGAARELPAQSVTSARAPAATLEVGVHDVAQLTGHERCAALIRALVSSAGETDVQSAIARIDRHTQLLADVADRTEGLLGAIESFMRPPLEGGDQRLVDLGDGRLALVGTPRQQAWLRDFLDGLADFEGFIEIDSRVVEMPLGSLARLGIARAWSTLTAADRAALDSRLADIRADVLSVPTVVTRPFGLASLFAGDQIAYIKDYELQILEGATIADPVIEVVEGGLKIDLRAVPLGDGRLAVDVVLTLTEVEEPIRQVETSLGVGNTVTIQLPEVNSVHVTSTVYLRDTDTALLTIVDPEGQRELLVLVSARKLDQLEPPSELQSLGYIDDIGDK
jgi:hypothetical protein